MSIRSLLSLRLPPLILVMGTLMALAAELSVRSELRRGVAEAGATVARATAEFVSSRRSEGRPYEEPLRRILGFGQVLEVRVAPPADAPPVSLSARAEASHAVDSPLSPAAMDALAQGRTWVGPLERRGEASVVRAAAPLEDGGSVAALVSVGTLVARAESLRRRFILFTAVFTLLGAAVALLSSRWIIAGVGALETQAVDLASGAPPGATRRTGIRELSDLALTFATMRSLLEDSVAQSRRALMARPLEDTLKAEILHDPGTARVDTTVGRHRISAHVVGTSVPGLLVGATEREGEGRAFVGRAGGSDQADAAVEAAAARVFLLAALGGKGDPSDAVHEAESRFRLPCLRWTRWSGQDEQPRRIHTLPCDAERALGALEALFAPLDQDAAGTAMANALSDLGPGVIMMIRPSDPVSTSPTEGV